MLSISVFSTYYLVAVEAIVDANRSNQQAEAIHPIEPPEANDEMSGRGWFVILVEGGWGEEGDPPWSSNGSRESLQVPAVLTCEPSEHSNRCIFKNTCFPF